MQPKPEHLGVEYAAQFSDPSVAAAYPHRPPYPSAIYPMLAGLIAGPRRVVLDIGCGTGDIARGLAPLVERVDAVDISAPMMAVGRALPGGDDPRLRWILGRAEEVALDSPYGLVTAGESLHWMQWETLMPRLAGLLAPGGVLAIAGREGRHPWDGDLQAIIPRYSTNRHFRPYDLIEELAARGLFTKLGEARTEPVETRQSVASFIEGIHSRNGFSRDRMDAADAAAFDRECAALLEPHADGGALTVMTTARVTWGTPHGP